MLGCRNQRNKKPWGGSAAPIKAESLSPWPPKPLALRRRFQQPVTRASALLITLISATKH